MILKENIINFVQEQIRETNFFLVDVKVSQRNEITVLFDKNDGVYVDDCSDLSRSIQNYFDRDTEDYKLTVCSPGVENPFLVEEQYFKNIGNYVQIKTIQDEIIKGKLISYNAGVTIESEDLRLNKEKKRSKIVRSINIPKEDIKETKLILKFK